MFQFVKGTTFYQTTAGSDVQEIKYSFAAEDTKATVKVLVNGKETAELSGNAVLTSGRNLIEVNVTAEDGVTMKNIVSQSAVREITMHCWKACR